jgi:hypothetical protein
MVRPQLQQGVSALRVSARAGWCELGWRGLGRRTAAWQREGGIGEGALARYCTTHDDDGEQQRQQRCASRLAALDSASSSSGA